MIDKYSSLAQLDLFLPTQPRPISPKYQLIVKGSTYYWTGRGRLPLVFDQYLSANQSKGNREQLLKGLLIQSVNSGVNHG